MPTWAQVDAQPTGKQDVDGDADVAGLQMLATLTAHTTYRQAGGGARHPGARDHVSIAGDDPCTPGQSVTSLRRQVGEGALLATRVPARVARLWGPV